MADDRNAWAASVWSPLLSDEPQLVLPPRNRTLERARTALTCTLDSDPDVATTRADLRAAMALAKGRSVNEICPSMGYDLSDTAFTAARDGWMDRLSRQTKRPLSEWTLTEHAKARAFWAAARPDLIAAWPEVTR